MTEKLKTKEEILKWIDKNVKYEYYTDSKQKKRIKKLLEEKTKLNCR